MITLENHIFADVDLAAFVTLSTVIAILTIGLIWKPTWKAIIHVLKREMIVQKNEMRPPQSDEGTP